MYILKVNSYHYIWYLTDKIPYAIDIDINGIAVASQGKLFRDIPPPEVLLKYGTADEIEWDKLPENVKICISATQQTIIERGIEQYDKNEKRR